jgi:hypothetical protein
LSDRPEVRCSLIKVISYVECCFVPARLVIVHAISPSAEAFYLHHGFTRLPVEAPALALVKFLKVKNQQ